ncbi:MAG: metallophosphoesterase [Bacteroidales bacterium]
MNQLKVLTLSLLIIILHGISNAQNSGSDTTWFFIQLTDPQFGMFENNEGFGKETVLYTKAVEKINGLKPDFVVITGDLVHDPDDESQIAEFKRITAQIDEQIPVYLIPGNHDVGGEPDKQSLEKYMTNYGYDRFSFIHKGVKLIGINTSLIKADLPGPEKKQYRWLKKEIKKNRDDLPVIMFGHYPFFIHSFDEPEKYSNIGIEKREKYISLFEQLGVGFVFSGHLHNNAYATKGTIEYVITNAVGKPLGDAPSGMRIIKINKGLISHDFYGLDEIPGKVRFGKCTEETSFK